MKSSLHNPAVRAAAIAVARRWPTPALHLKGGATAVPVEVLEPGIRELVDKCTLRVVTIYGRQCVVIIA